MAQSNTQVLGLKTGEKNKMLYWIKNSLVWERVTGCSVHVGGKLLYKEKSALRNLAVVVAVDVGEK